MVPEALPLDELAHKAGVPVAAFFAVWGSAALLLGLLARAARLDRLTAAVVLLVGVGAFEFLARGSPSPSCGRSRSTRPS